MLLIVVVYGLLGKVGIDVGCKVVYFFVSFLGSFFQVIVGNVLILVIILVCIFGESIMFVSFSVVFRFLVFVGIVILVKLLENVRF